MTSGREMVRVEANRRGFAAATALFVTLLGTGLAASSGAFVLAGAMAVTGGIWTARRTWEWLRYRGEWGLRF